MKNHIFMNIMIVSISINEQLKHPDAHHDMVVPIILIIVILTKLINIAVLRLLKRNNKDNGTNVTKVN